MTIYYLSFCSFRLSKPCKVSVCPIVRHNLVWFGKRKIDFLEMEEKEIPLSAEKREGRKYNY